LRESFIAVESLAGYTKDNVPVWISGSLFYVIDDPELACYKIQNYSGSVEAIGRSAMRAVIGQFEFDSIIRERSAINTALSQTIGNTLKDWCSTYTRFEIGMFQPQNQAVAEQLQLQLEAERKRRENELNTLARIKTAEGDKETAILKSEGELVSRTNQSEGDLILSQRQSDAEKYSIDVTTAALVKQLEAVAQLFDGNKDKAANYLLEKQRLEHLSVLAKSPNKVYFADPDSMLPKARALTDMLT
jgi:regulator of protease activity HflC (stomatin/prohibitin superfamily)